MRWSLIYTLELDVIEQVDDAEHARWTIENTGAHFGPVHTHKGQRLPQWGSSD
jgi:hypothetical protein